MGLKFRIGFFEVGVQEIKVQRPAALQLAWVGVNVGQPACKLEHPPKPDPEPLLLHANRRLGRTATKKKKWRVNQQTMCCIGQPPYIHSCDIVNKYCGLKLGTASKLPVHTQLSVDQSSYNLLCGISCKDKLHSRRSPTRIIFPILWTENVHHPVIAEKATEQFFFHSLCPRCWSRVCNSFSRYFLITVKRGR